jgi:hypothetical protein
LQKLRLLKKAAAVEALSNKKAEPLAGSADCL